MFSRVEKTTGKLKLSIRCRRPKDIFYKEEIKAWEENEDSNVHLTVDEPDETWGGTCGVCVYYCLILMSIPGRQWYFYAGLR